MNYKHIYMCIVAHAKSQQLESLRPQNKNDLKRNFKGQYFEFHHILPKSMFPNWSTRDSNIVPLTAREHFFCHQLLYKIYPTHSMICALYHLINRINYKENTKIKITSREYERIKIEFSKKHSQYEKEHSSNFGTHWYTNGAENVKARECPAGFRPGRIGLNQNWIKGKHLKDVMGEEYAKEKSRKISLAQKGKHRITEEGRKSISKHLKGRVSPTKKLIWCNNGIDQKMLKELPKGWVLGRLDIPWNKGKAVRKTQ